MFGRIPFGFNLGYGITRILFWRNWFFVSGEEYNWVTKDLPYKIY